MTVELRAGQASVVIDAEDGGRLSSFALGGRELLYQALPGPTGHGSFVMAPYAGRVRHGTFTHHDTEVHLPINLPPHAAHGLTLDRPWTVLERDETEALLTCKFDGRWPFGGRVVQYIRIEPDRLVQKVSVEADQRSFPASVGWHPWFSRRLHASPPVDITLDAPAMLRRDADHMTTTQRMRPLPGPWDDCFVDVAWPVSLTWPGAIRLDITADTNHVVVFDQGDVAVCVEPQTAPPNSVNTAPLVVRPGRPLRARTDWRWVIN